MKKTAAFRAGGRELKPELPVSDGDLTDIIIEPEPESSRPPADETRRLCRDAALRLLDYRPRSRAEVADRLAGRFADEVIAATLAGLTSQGLLDDGEFARYWKGNRNDFRPRSRALIAVELRRKGVGADIISGALDDVDDGENAYRAAGEKARRSTYKDYNEFRRRLTGYLRRRGFNYEVISRTLERVWQEKNI
jgi:regulatory protein